MVQYEKLCNGNIYMGVTGAWKRNGLVLPGDAQGFTENVIIKLIIEKRVEFTKQKIGKYIASRKMSMYKALEVFKSLTIEQ